MLALRHALALALLVALHPAPAAAESCACGAPARDASLMSEAGAEAMMSALLMSDASLASDPGAWPLYEPPSEEPSVLLAAHEAASLPLADLASFMPSLQATRLEADASPEPAERPAWCEGSDDPRCQAPLPASAGGELSVGPFAPLTGALSPVPPLGARQVMRPSSLLGASSGRGARLDRPPRG